MHTPRSSEDEQKHILRGSGVLETRDQGGDSPPARLGRWGGLAQARIQAWLRPGPRSLHFRACAPRSLEARLPAGQGAPFFPDGARV